MWFYLCIHLWEGNNKVNKEMHFASDISVCEFYSDIHYVCALECSESQFTKMYNGAISSGFFKGLSALMHLKVKCLTQC